MPSAADTSRSNTSPLLTEEIHSPAPHPARGIYGFALYIVGWCFLVAYIVWAFVPTPILNRLGITYVPAKYWAVAVPLLIPIVIITFVTVIFSLNLIRFRGYGIFNDVEIVDNDFGERAGFHGLPAEDARKELIGKCISCDVLRMYI